MYKKIKPTHTKLINNDSYDGESIEQKIQRIVNNREPITDGAPIVYTERKDGVLPEYNIRTDRWEVAVDAMDKVTAAHQAKREERHKPKEEAKKDTSSPSQEATKNEGGAQPIRATKLNKFIIKTPVVRTYTIL